MRQKDKGIVKTVVLAMYVLTMFFMGELYVYIGSNGNENVFSALFNRQGAYWVLGGGETFVLICIIIILSVLTIFGWVYVYLRLVVDDENEG